MLSRPLYDERQCTRIFGIVTRDSLNRQRFTKLTITFIQQPYLKTVEIESVEDIAAPFCHFFEFPTPRG